MCSNCNLRGSSKKFFLLLSFIFIATWGVNGFSAGNHDKMDHSKMDHGKMDHGKMDHGKMDHGKMDHSKMDHSKGRKALDKETRKSIISVLEANEELHNSFFKYEGKRAELAARKVKSAILGIKNTEVSKLLTFSSSKLDEITSSNDREKNNQNYHLVSMALIHVVNTYDVGKKYNAYSCPMVKKKWLQNSRKLSKVSNPYAPNMPHCGTQDTKF